MKEHYSKPRHTNESKVAALRLSKSMTQKELSEAVGVAQCYISLIENRREISVKLAKKIANIFDVDWRDLYD